MSVLSGELRRLLERAVLEGRGVAEGAAASALGRLGVGLRDAPGHLSGEERSLRVALRARARQLGDQLERSDAPARCGWRVRCWSARSRTSSGTGSCLRGSWRPTACCTTREYRVPVSLADCEELAAGLGEPDGWSVAARFAAEIFRGSSSRRPVGAGAVGA